MNLEKSATSIVPYEKRYEAQMLALAHAMHAESLLHRDMSFDDAKVVALFEAASQANALIYAKLYVKGEEALGLLLGGIIPMFFGHSRLARDLAWYVKPSARGTSAGIALVADFEAWVA